LKKPASQMIVIGPVSIDENEIGFRFIHSSGPGGQNVNKVATAVQLRFDVYGSPSLPDRVKERLATLAGKRINSEGVLVIEARRFREQAKNRQDAIDRLRALVEKAMETPRARKPTRPSRASRKRRVDQKVKRGRLKRTRGKIKETDE